MIVSMLLKRKNLLGVDVEAPQTMKRVIEVICLRLGMLCFLGL